MLASLSSSRAERIANHLDKEKKPVIQAHLSVDKRELGFESVSNNKLFEINCFLGAVALSLGSVST